MSTPEATKAELLEILGQLGITGHTDAEPTEDLYQACLDAGLTDQVIAAEVAEQRGR